MCIKSLLLIISTISLSLAIASCAQVQANQFACEQPKVETRSPQSYAGTALGELKVDGKKISLAYAYAIATDPVWEDDKALKRTKTAYTLLVTERAMPNRLLENFLLGKRVTTESIVQDGIKGLLIALDNKGYNPTFLYPPPSGWGFSSSSNGIEPGKLQIATDRIAGEITGSAPLIQNFEYKFSFKAPIRQPYSATKLFTGEAALNTAPVKVYLAYLDALQQKNIDQMRLYLKDENLQVLNRLVAEIGKEKFFSELNLYISLAKKLNNVAIANPQKLEEIKSKLSQLTLSKIANERNISSLEFLPLTTVLLIDSRTLKQHLHKVAIRGGESKISLKVDPTETPITSTVSLDLSCENSRWKL